MIDKILSVALTALHHTAIRCRGLNVVKTIEAGNFLRKILHIAAIITPGRYGDLIGLVSRFLNRKTDALENLDHSGT